MFEELRFELPNYAVQIETIRGRMPNNQNDPKIIDELKVWRKTNECLFKAMSHVYVDILQFCHDAYRLFSKKRRGKLIPQQIILLYI
jgi:hypothetical protein